MSYRAGVSNPWYMDRYQSVDHLDLGQKKVKCFPFFSIFLEKKGHFCSHLTTALWCCGEPKTKFSGAVFRKRKTNDEKAKGSQTKQKQSCSWKKTPPLSLICTDPRKPWGCQQCFPTLRRRQALLRRSPLKTCTRPWSRDFITRTPSWSSQYWSWWYGGWNKVSNFQIKLRF